MKITNTKISVIFAAILLSACNKNIGIDTSKHDNYSKTTNSYAVYSNTQMLSQDYSKILYNIFKKYDIATPHTYEDYFTEIDISPYYLGEKVDIDLGSYKKTSECTKITLADIDNDSLPEMCLSRMEPQEYFTSLEWIDVYKQNGVCIGSYISGQLWESNDKIYSCAYDLTYGALTSLSDNFSYVYCTLGVPVPNYKSYDLIIGDLSKIEGNYDYSNEEWQSSSDFIDVKFNEACAELFGTDMTELYETGNELYSVTKVITLPNLENYTEEDIYNCILPLLESYYEEG